MKAALAAIALSGCAMFSTEQETATRDMLLAVTIDSSDAGTHVTAQISGPFGDPDLGPSDTFSATVAGAPLPLAEIAPASWTADTGARAGDFVFALHHENDHDVTAAATLPGPSGLAAAQAGTDLAITWTPQLLGGATTTLTVSGTCIGTKTIAILSDSGHYKLQAAQLQSFPVACTLTVALARALSATVSPFEGGTFMQAQISQTESVQTAWNP